MCLYPKLLKNKKYIANQKNGGIIPPFPIWKGKEDKRVLFVPVKCGRCEECVKGKAREWSVRLMEELKEKKGQFVTLTFSTESLRELAIGINAEGYELDNQIAKKAVKRFRERWRKEKGKSPRYWLITEIGGERYEHLHIHGIIFEEKEPIEKHWKYGYIFIGDECNERTVNYIVKYLHQEDEKHPNYNPIVLTSNGMGRNYLNRIDSRNNKFNGKNTKEYYRTSFGTKVNLNVYYRNKLYNEHEREILWLQKLDSGYQWIAGQKIKNDNHSLIDELREQARATSIAKGYRDDTKNWEAKQYEERRRALLQKNRLQQGRNR